MFTGQSAKNGPVDQTSSSRIVEIEHAPNQLASSKKTGYRCKIIVEHLCAVRIDPETAKGEGDATANLVCLERAFVNSVGPIGFRYGQLI